MHVNHKFKIHELAETMATALKIECETLYRSGAINIESYDKDNYALAKILITAAMERLKNNLAPRSDNKKYWKDIKSLIEE